MAAIASSPTPSPDQLEALRRLTPEQRYRASREMYWTLRRHKAAFLRSGMPEPDLIELFVARLDEIGAHYLVTGSVAATLYGELRATHDIDLVVELSAEQRNVLPNVFPADELSRRRKSFSKKAVDRSEGTSTSSTTPPDWKRTSTWSGATNSTPGRCETHAAIPLAELRSTSRHRYVITRKLEFYREGGLRTWHATETNGAPESVAERHRRALRRQREA